ncbi:MAG TPA: hypothetical protein DCY72_04870, partial [Ruminococcaceae bacterium]|nr:hypothetical protein [Oscillospiraceae bacterium]
MKRIICLALCALAALLACACGNTKDSTPTQAPQEETQAPQTPDSVPPTEDGNSLSLKKFISSFDKKPEVAEQKKLYEDENLSVSVKGIDYTAVSGPQLQLNIENRSNKEIVAQSPYSIVNGYMITPELNGKIAAAKSADCSLTLPYFKLAIANITSIKKVEFAVRLVDAKTYNPITTTDLITVETSAKQDEEVECDESGQVAYDKDDIKIIFKGVNIDRAYSDGAELMVYMYNGTDQKIAVRAKDVVVNGYTMTSAMNSTILPNKRAVDVVTFYKLDMEEHDIVDIDSIKVSFTIKDADNWETIDSTDMISV